MACRAGLLQPHPENMVRARRAGTAVYATQYARPYALRGRTRCAAVRAALSRMRGPAREGGGSGAGPRLYLLTVCAHVPVYRARPSARPSTSLSARPYTRPSARPSARPSTSLSARPYTRPFARPYTRPSTRGRASISCTNPHVHTDAAPFRVRAPICTRVKRRGRVRAVRLLVCARLYARVHAATCVTGRGQPAPVAGTATGAGPLWPLRVQSLALLGSGPRWVQSLALLGSGPRIACRPSGAIRG
jgi:hypothetical protein